MLDNTRGTEAHVPSMGSLGAEGPSQATYPALQLGEACCTMDPRESQGQPGGSGDQSRAHRGPGQHRDQELAVGGAWGSRAECVPHSSDPQPGWHKSWASVTEEEVDA